MIIDVFPALDELELAKFRIDYLKDLVDVVVIGESKLTHSGIEKPLYLRDWHESLDPKRQSQIHLIEIELNKDAGSWEREIYSREYLVNYCKNTFSNAKIILSDLDEIPSQGQVKYIQNNAGIFHFLTPTCYRYLNWQLSDSHKHWAKGIMGDLELLNYPNGGRFVKELTILKSEPGAHLSYLGFSSEKLRNKLLSFAHTELQSAAIEASAILELSDKYKIDHLGRFESTGSGLITINKNFQSDVLLAASKTFPNLIDLNPKVPSYLCRILASAKLSAYFNFGIAKNKSLNNIGMLLIIKQILIGNLRKVKRLINR